MQPHLPCGAHRRLTLTAITDPPRRDRWAHLRFSIVGPLMAAPPEPGQLYAALAALSIKMWRHPETGLDVRFGVSTLERWYYAAKRAGDPVAALRDRLRGDLGRFLSPTGINRPLRSRHKPATWRPGWAAA